jgi:hypothetical protein
MTRFAQFSNLPELMPQWSRSRRMGMARMERDQERA